MGNHRFRLSDMLPNAWFYKLRDMSRTTRNHNTTNTKKGLPSCNSSITTTTHKHYQYQYQYSSSHSRNSSYYTPRPNHIYNSTTSHFPTDPPRKSSRRKRKTIYKPSPNLNSVLTESTQPHDHFLLSSSDSHESFNSCKLTSSATDIIIEVRNAKKSENYNGFDSIPEIDLPPIITKPKLPEETTLSVKTAPARKSASKASKKIQGAGGGGRGRSKNNKSSKSTQKTKKKSFSESLVIVESSFDPQKDFRESMVEMIIENNIRASKDLEHLLACYLSLNSDEYHDLIVKAFEQIWFNLPHF